ncbi:MAG: CRISPR-associated endonuclease Cas1, partial [Lachnospiraceae bacterium]|nr:CRISPR-associated endonuclease Cas1 [Lachnospiraceae bacterium]
MIVVVQEYGASVGKRSNCLVIKNGNGEKEISSDQVTELHVFPSCSISSDAIRLCMEKDIWVVFLNKYGEPTGEVTPFAGGSAPFYKRNQLLLTHRREG